MEEKKLEEEKLDDVNGAGEAIYGSGGTGAVWIGGSTEGFSQPDIEGASPFIDKIIVDR